MIQTLNVKMYSGSLCFIVFYLFLSFLTNLGGAQHIKSPATDFRRHSIVQPVLHHGRTKREITSTRHTDGLHHPEVTMTVNLGGVENILDLVLNEGLIPGDHAVIYQKNGSVVTNKPSIEELDICQYSGKVRNKTDSWVALSTCDGVRGVIYDGQHMRYIEPAQVDTEIGSKHFVYDHSDLSAKSTCGYYDGINIKDDLEHLKMQFRKQSKKFKRSIRYKRRTQNSEVKEIQGPFKVNKKSRFVELVLVADRSLYEANDENIQTVYRQLKDIANIMNSLYAPLNIFIALVGVVIWTERDEISLNGIEDDTLSNFLKYRKGILSNTMPNDNAQLLTMKKSKDGIVGNALKGTICTFEFSGGLAVNHSAVIGLVASTVAHGLGHNFGMNHDFEPDCECLDEKCIMNPSVGSVAPTHWSVCSRHSLALSFEMGMDHCLRNKPKRLFDSPTCGNGFVEPGEQCDCGLRPDPACAECCDPQLCVLRANATCASGECCDPRRCRLKAASTVCRSATSECDLPEYCTGHSEFCPKDVYKMNGLPCASDQAFCIQGSCTTHTDQCRLLWGATGRNSDAECYQQNTRANRYANCGYTRATETKDAQYLRCDSEDVLCGRLHCKHLNERLEYGLETAAKLSAAFINNNGTIKVCRAAVIDLGTQDVDPGMVPDGAKCGDDKMCLNQKCVGADEVRNAVATLRETSICPSGCSGHGVCNSEGHCHCDPGFSPPGCFRRGASGSRDSGPAEFPEGLFNIWDY